MTRRRDDLRALFAGDPPAAMEATPQADAPADGGPETKALVPRFLRPEPAPPDSFPSPTPLPSLVQRSSSGALKAMGLELDALRQAAEEAESLKRQLRSGETIVELDPGLIDDAFVRDRMPEGDARDAALEASLRDHGQQAPILVRPHPAAPGRYEAIYGHRRLAALARLGRPVKAVVRPLDDEALVIAQGQENNARADLSFIERARYAAALERRGFSRATVKAALDVHSADITRYAAVVGAIPDWLTEAIGPAPGVGRPRWTALAAALGAAYGGPLPAALRALTEDPAFRAMPSEARFAAAMRAADPRRARPTEERPIWRSVGGEVTVERRAGTDFRIAGTAGLGFAAFMAERMDELIAEFAGGKPVRKLDRSEE